MNNVFQEVNDWEQFAQDNRIQGLLDAEDYPKNSAMYKINAAMNNMSPEQQRRVKQANLYLALASHNQSFAEVAERFAKNPLVSEGVGSAKRGQKQRLLDDDFAGKSASRAVEHRGSSLFIKRVADLEKSDQADSSKNHFKDSRGNNIEMSENSPFQLHEEAKQGENRDERAAPNDLPQIEEEIN